MIVDQLVSRQAWPIASVVAMDHAWRWFALPDWMGIVRSVMMVLGGLVVIALTLIVAVAVISGVMGMIGKLRKKS